MENKPMSLLLIEDDEFECKKFKTYIETLNNVNKEFITEIDYTK